jgi:hypothetical protein
LHIPGPIVNPATAVEFGATAPTFVEIYKRLSLVHGRADKRPDPPDLVAEAPFALAIVEIHNAFEAGVNFVQQLDDFFSNCLVVKACH